MSRSSRSQFRVSRRSFLYTSSAAIATLLATSCRRQPQAEANAAQQPLRLGFNLWAGYLPFQVAKEKALFQANGLNADITWFPALADQITAFNAGKVDVAGLTIADFLTGVSNGVKAKAVLQMDTSLGADAIGVAPSIQSLQDFAGKNASVEVGTVEHLLFLQALKKSGLPENSVQVTNQASDAAITALIAGRTQIAASYEPFISQALSSGKGKVIFSSKDVPGLIADLLVVRQEVLEQRPEAVQKLVKVWYQTLDYRQKNLDAALAIEAKQAGSTVDELKKIGQGVKWQTPQESTANFQAGQTTESIVRAGGIITAFLLDKKMITAKPPSMTALLDGQFLKQHGGLN